ncbi:MAG: DNA-3-methyladenine glycosylase 2 family protein [Defluviitaleaceae bacterium]|nr:DNA-3-methyladenine glycosylase 2 family protein [Defluviitaleaceae bacterium]
MPDFSSVEHKNNDTVLTNTRFFDLRQTLDNGQAFRWVKTGESSYSGIAHGRRLDLRLDDGDGGNGSDLVIKNCSPQEFDTIWKEYFDFNRDYEEIRLRLGGALPLFSDCSVDVLRSTQNINLVGMSPRSLDSSPAEKKEALPPSPDFLTNAVTFAHGLRLLKQDPWETLISFILSQNSNIPRIKKMVQALCENFGEGLPCGGFAFPTPQALAALSASQLAPIKSGYRAPYILDAACRVAGGEIDLSAMENLSSDKIFRTLLAVKGVGEKVAECVLLYGFGRVERFPADVWIKRVMDEHYPSGFPQEFWDISGIAQQFLFYFAREAKNEK